MFFFSVNYCKWTFSSEVLGLENYVIQKVLETSEYKTWEEKVNLLIFRKDGENIHDSEEGSYFCKVVMYPKDQSSWAGQNVHFQSVFIFIQLFDIVDTLPV